MGIRNFLVGLVAVIILVWGPRGDSSWPDWFGLGLWAFCFFALPIGFWYFLAYVWRVWQPDKAAEDRLERTIAGALAGTLALGAILLLQAEPGTRGLGFVLLLSAPYAFWYGLELRS